MTALAQRLDVRLHKWKPVTAANVEHLVNEIIELADVDAPELVRVRNAEQVILDLIDEPQTR
jgi:hypothetical protein